MPRRDTSKLNEEQRAFAVQRLACFDTPKQVADALKAEFRVEISPQAAEAYDPTKRAGEKLAQKWRDLFKATRARFLDKLEEVPEANKAVRVRRLARMAEAAESRGNFVLAANLLEQIAKEVGNSYTNRRELTGKDGKPIETRDVTNLTDEQLDAEMAAIVGVAGEDDDAA